MVKEARIAILVDSLRCGGAEKVASLVASELKEVKWLLVINKDKEEFWKPKLTNTHRLGFYSGNSKPLQALNLIYAFAAFLIFTHKNKPDKILSFLYLSHFFNYFSSFIFKKTERFYSERSVLYKSYSGLRLSIYASLIKIIYKKASGVIFISKYILTSLLSKRHIIPNHFVIHNPVKTINKNRYLENRTRASGTKSDTIELCVVCRLTKTKNINFLILGLKTLQERHPSRNFTLHIYGDGPDRINLEKSVEDHMLRGKVFFMGMQHEPFEQAVNHDLFLFSSNYESFGNVCIESMSYGLPVIYSNNLESFKEIIGETLSSKLEFKDGDIDSLCKTTIEALANAKEISAALHKRHHLFSYDTIISKYSSALGITPKTPHKEIITNPQKTENTKEPA